MNIIVHCVNRKLAIVRICKQKEKKEGKEKKRTPL